MMADLFIWQLLGYFKKILHRECYAGETTYEQAGDNSTDFIWSIDADLLGQNITIADIREWGDGEIPKFISSSYSVYPVAARLTMYSPVIERAVPTGKTAGTLMLTRRGFHSM